MHMILSKTLCHAATFPLTLAYRLPRWQTHIKSSSMRTTRSTTKKQTALAKSPLGRLVDQASPLLKLILGKIPADDGFVVQLACEPLHAIIKERFATSGGVKTTVGGVVSSGSGAGRTRRASQSGSWGGMRTLAGSLLVPAGWMCSSTCEIRAVSGTRGGTGAPARKRQREATSKC